MLQINMKVNPNVCNFSIMEKSSILSHKGSIPNDWENNKIIVNTKNVNILFFDTFCCCATSFFSHLVFFFLLLLKGSSP